MKINRIKANNPLSQKVAKALQSVEAEVEYRKLMVVEELLQFMKRKGVNKSELAARMGIQPSRVTAMLAGDSNLTIETLVRAGRAVGASLQQTYVPAGQIGHWVHYNKIRSKGRTALVVDFQPKKIQLAQNPQPISKQRAQYDAEDAA